VRRVDFPARREKQLPSEDFPAPHNLENVGDCPTACPFGASFVAENRARTSLARRLPYAFSATSTVSGRHLMTQELPVVYLARHGETAWSLSGQHTGLTDLPLTARGERNARSLGERLKGLRFALVLTSPLQRAVRTCELAGFGAEAEAEADRDLLEWDYGQYEGRRTADIHRERPGWQLFPMAAPEENRRNRSPPGLTTS